MKAELIIPVDVLRGKLNNEGYYFRKYRGQQIVQRCPVRTYHERTFAEIANQKRFSMIATEVARRLKAGEQKSRKKLWKEVVKKLSL
jgi:hypothetical protein